MKILTVIILAMGLIFLVWKRLMHVDLSFIFFVALIFLGIASLSENFISFTAGIFGIVYEPLVIILITIFLLLCIIIILVIFVTKLNKRHTELVRRVAVIELSETVKNKEKN